jgi:hypothetical protein
MDADELNLDFDKLRSSLDIQAIAAFAHNRCALSGGSSNRVNHLSEVGDDAYIYAGAIYTAVGLAELKYCRQVCQAAGLLHECMLQGCTFEDLVDVADEAVARVVATITPDVRMPRPKRLMMLANQIGLAPATAAAVKLADLRHDMSLLGLDNDINRDSVKLWIEEAQVVSDSFHKLRTTPLKSRLVELKSLIDTAEQSLRRPGKKKLSGRSQDRDRTEGSD